MTDVLPKIQTSLTDVPETTLWTLHNRAVECMRPDSILKDPKCIEIYNKIDYDYERSFGKADASHAIRSLAFDKEIKRFLKAHPNGLVIGLGEGLETEVYRCDNGQNRWLSIDLPSTMQIREKFIHQTDRIKHLAKSATDLSWLDEVQDEPVFITAQGLLMYFPEDEVKKLIQAIDQKFSHYELMFDTIPHWFSNLTLKGLKKTKYYQTPPMPWGLNEDEVKPLIGSWLPMVKSIETVGYEFPRGFYKYFVWVFKRIPVIKNKKPLMVLVKK